MDGKTIAEQTLLEHETLQHVKAALRATLDWQVDRVGLERKVSSVKFIVESFRRHLERLMGLEEHGGYMTMVWEKNPNLNDRVERLRSDHDSLRSSLARILPRIEQDPQLGEEEVSTVCAELTAMLDELDRHDRDEIELLQEAFLRDEGGEG